MSPSPPPTPPPAPRSIPFSPCLPPLPDSPLSSASFGSARSVTFSQQQQQQQQHPSQSLSLSASLSMSASTSASASSLSNSTSYSHYQSPLASPACPRSRDSSGGAVRLDTTTDEEDEQSSSDVEIYLSSLGINDSAASLSLALSQSQARNTFGFSQQQHQQQQRTSPKAPIDDSPVLPSHLQAQAQPQPQSQSQPQAQTQTQCQSQSQSQSHPQAQAQALLSPQLPPAPAQHTIPLPTLSGSSPAFTFTPSSSSLPSNNPDFAAGATQTQTQADTAAGKTPNVYINGLPPHFPEDQLYALAAPFGTVKSVRTFTRHVRDTESGYGFVLFDTVEAAEKCIVSLRRYRNLHPTFSKQAHKIPGTSSAPLSLPLNLPPPQHLNPNLNLSAFPPRALSLELTSGSESDAGWEEAYGGARGGGAGGGGTGTAADASFKAKMESLADRTSTNLYMEGLPLSIDEPTLAALVSPHRISSSRFFQTRLSNPPRIIAFVRYACALSLFLVFLLSPPFSSPLLSLPSHATPRLPLPIPSPPPSFLLLAPTPS
ncbi:putative RNA recognition motif containing protein [Lyophyllum shimeji]|uniref:RNA recognition motif containing protein n=1 Tax=Lyophyllum shimeji TaxID=47721 RepID=A0A9P3PMB7_LYOSH|nr:putative RNA recognition motif containing protein [Lyophyllum shimeji]